MRRAAVILGRLLGLVVLVGLTARTGPVRAQGDGSCLARVAEALAALNADCQDAARNTACYGHGPLTVRFWDSAQASAFARPGDAVNTLDVHTIAGSPLSASDGAWGLSLLRLQADAPDALPDTYLTVLLVGDVTVQNNVPPEEARPPVTPIALRTTAGVNLRGGPGTSFPIISSARLGDTLQAIGRSAAGDWLQVAVDSGRAWVTAAYVQAAGDTSTLPVMTDAVPPGPLESLSLRTGGTLPPCQEALPAHLLVHGPAGMPIAFTADGVRFTLQDATAALQAADDRLTVTVFTGEVDLRVGSPCAAGCAVIIPAGYAVDVPLGSDGLTAAGAPVNGRLLDPDAWVAYLDVWSRFPDGLAGVPAFDLWGLLEETGNLAWNDIEVALRWEGPADLDLTVIEPNGTVIYYGHPESGTGGRLAADANYPCGSRADPPLELVSWPTGHAPLGTYQVQIDQFDSCGAESTSWTLTVRVNGQEVLSRAGAVTPRAYTFTR